MTSPTLSFIIVNRNGGAFLRECLEAITRQTFDDYEVVVVDNASTDGSVDLPYFADSRHRLIRLDRNTGFAEPNGIGYQASRGQLIALVNNDVQLTPDWAEKMVAAFADERVGMAACRLLQMRDPTRLDSAGFAQHTWGSAFQWYGWAADALDERSHQPFGPTASAGVYRRAAIDRTGLFHPCYFAYYEDNDLAMRLILHGYRCRYVHQAVALHHGSATGKRASDFHRYHLRRNIELLYWVNMVGGLAWKHGLLHFLYEAACLAGMIAQRQGTVFWRAKRDALRMRPWILKERAALRQSLATQRPLREAQRDLESRLCSLRTALWRSGRGLPRPPSGPASAPAATRARG